MKNLKLVINEENIDKFIKSIFSVKSMGIKGKLIYTENIGGEHYKKAFEKNGLIHFVIFDDLMKRKLKMIESFTNRELMIEILELITDRLMILLMDGKIIKIDYNANGLGVESFLKINY